MKLELDKKRFLRNIMICIIALIIVAFILNISPGYKRDKYASIINLIINDTNVTENLKNKIYTSENGAIYISKEDISNFFDETIYYDEQYSTVITTSETKVASMKLGEDQMVVNNATFDLLSPVIIVDNNIYVPITELEDVYNIEINYVKETKKVIIDELDKGLIMADVSDESIIKSKPRSLSMEIGQISIGEEISCFYTTSKGWRLIRTSDGTLGYVKANVLTNERILRQDVENEIETKEITISLKDNATSYIQNEDEKINVIIQNLFVLNNENRIEEKESTFYDENYQIWATISNESFEKQTNKILSDYINRAMLINMIENVIIKNEINGINIDFTGITEKDDFTRFIIELAPRLREKGIVTNIVLNNGIESEELIGVAEYLINEKE